MEDRVRTALIVSDSDPASLYCEEGLTSETKVMVSFQRSFDLIII